MPDGAPAAQAAQPQAKQAPFGGTSAVAPTPNRGHEAAAAQRLGLAISNMTEALALAGAASEMGQSILDALKKVSKFSPPGSQSQAGQRNATESMLMKQAQQAQAMQQMKAQAAQAGAGQPGMQQMMQPKAA